MIQQVKNLTLQNSKMQEQDISNYYKMYDQDETIKENIQPSSYLDLLHFADKLDILLMTIGTGFGLFGGISIIFYSRPLGLLVDAFSETDKQKIVQGAIASVYGFLTNSVFVFAFTWLSTAVWVVSSQRQMNRARKQYFLSLINQQTAWHDRNKPQQIGAKMFNQIKQVQQVLVTHILALISRLSITICGITISLIRGWQMALIMICFLPVMFISAKVNAWYHSRAGHLDYQSRIGTQSGVIEVFQNIKTVKMLGGQSYQQTRFSRVMQKITKLNISNKFRTTFSFAFMMLCIYLNYALGFWYGARLVSLKIINDNTGNNYIASDVIVIFFTVYISNLSISGLSDIISIFNFSRFSMRRILSVVNRKSKIVQGTQQIPQYIQSISFKDVTFRYQRPLLSNFNLKIKKGITALIGESGNGKTTLINLIMRFYDVFNGQVTLDSDGKSENIKSFTFKSLRQKIGYVGQEPVLLGKTIREVLYAQDLSDSQVQDILQIVKAKKFVNSIGLDTQFKSLSGGQKQRIAIARALVKKPNILILDQGTSALDRRTESDVLKAIKKLNIPFIIMISHRTQTLVNADCIIKMESGKIVAQGTYAIMLQRGIISKNQTKLQSENQQNKQMIQLQLFQQKNPNNQEIGPQQKKQSQIKPFKFNYIKRLMKKQSKWFLYPISIVSSCVIGATFPIFSFLLSNIVVVLSAIELVPPQELPQYQERVFYLSLTLFMLSFISSFTICIKGTTCQYLTHKLRLILKRNAFHIAINKPMTQIDTIGTQSLSYLININCDDLKDLGSSHIISAFETLSTLAVGLTIAFIHCWQISFVSLLLFPIIIVCGAIQNYVNGSLKTSSEKLYQKNHEILLEAMIHHKTVKSLNVEQKIISNYSNGLDGIFILAIKSGNFSGIMLGLGQALISVTLALIFYVGALLIRAEVSNVLNIYIAIYSIQFTGIQAGMTFGFLNTIIPSKNAACKYFDLIEKQPQQDNMRVPKDYHDFSILQQRPQQANIITKGKIKIENLQFKYQSRDKPVFQKLNLQIPAGEKIALVGQSGSGKSTIANLLFRIYEPTQGNIFIDGIDIKNYQLNTLKTQIGIVSQQPMLFNRSVYENIKYNTDATFDDVVEAVKQANAYQFICEGNFGIINKRQAQLKESGQNSEVTIQQFHKIVGSRGSYLSGGQKQRIAIARAIVRKPVIMVLDEATSALDNANQKIVQEALQNINGITQIIIAHRLSTVQNCDNIIVLKQGEIVQQGTYWKLIQAKGQFYRIANALKSKDIEPNINLI